MSGHRVLMAKLAGIAVVAIAAVALVVAVRRRHSERLMSKQPDLVDVVIQLQKQSPRVQPVCTAGARRSLARGGSRLARVLANGGTFASRPCRPQSAS